MRPVGEAPPASSPDSGVRSPDSTKAEILYCYGVVGVRLRPVDWGLPGFGAGPECVAAGGHEVLIERVVRAQFDERHLEDPAWVLDALRIHEAVVERAMQEATILPARFATLFTSLPELARRVLARKATLSRQLGQLEDREEWGLQIDGRRPPPTPVAPASGSPRAPGRAFLQARRGDIGQSRQAVATPDMAGHFIEGLGRASAAGRTLSTDPMRLAFLVERDRREGFRRAVRRLVSSLPGEADVRLSGPWPPYHFCKGVEAPRG